MMLVVEGIRMGSRSSVEEIEILMEVTNRYGDHLSGHEGLKGNIIEGDNKVGENLKTRKK